MFRLFCLCLSVFMLTVPAGAAPLRGPTLGVASNFGQSWYPDILKAAQQIPVRNFRDEIFWRRIETSLGAFTFDQGLTNFPDLMAQQGASFGFLAGGTHPSYDGDTTPHSAHAHAAFGAMAASVVRRFPSLASVEVGNEFNSQDFVSGPVKAAGQKDRVRFYLEGLKETHRQVKAANPDIRILGGAVLAVPGGYLNDLFQLGAADYMDALAIHPYTTPPEQLARQIATLRRISGLETMPIEVTEYGDPNAETAPATLMKAYCQMALVGVTRLVWYPLSPRGDGLTPLLDQDNQLTATGRGYQTIARYLEGREVRDISPDPFTYACRFGRDRTVIWGEPRRIFLRPGQSAFDATGKPLPPKNLSLSMEQPLLIITSGTAGQDRPLELGRQKVLADSYHQFTFPSARTASAPESGFIRLTQLSGHETAFVFSPGQDAPSTLWTPSLADPHNGYIRLTDRLLRPDGSGDSPTEIIHRYRAPSDASVKIEARWQVFSKAGDGIRIRISLNDKTLQTYTGKGPFAYGSDRITLKTGDILEFSVGPNQNAEGDLTKYRITLRKTR